MYQHGGMSKTESKEKWILESYSFVEMGKLILNFTWKCQRPRIAKTIIRKNKFGAFTAFNFKTDKSTLNNQNSVILGLG